MTPPLSSDELDRLEQLAREATPGPWVAQSRDDGRSEPWYIDTHAYPDGPEPVWVPPQYPVGLADAAFIAAANPAVVSELVAAARLGAAWQEAEAALPEGWEMGSLVAAVAFEGGIGSTESWRATAYTAYVGFGRSIKDDAEGVGPTPAAALLALAEALRERP